jgi:hypothetical protein
MENNFRNKQMPLQAETAAVSKFYPQFTSTGSFQRRMLKGLLRPSESSVDYTIHIILRLSHRPEVHIVSPELAKNPPHVYKNNDNALCLYYPPAIDRNEPLFVSKKLIPWISAWLFFYECWRLTGVWCGDEINHSNEKQN